jgi:hypothetical protein
MWRIYECTVTASADMRGWVVPLQCIEWLLQEPADWGGLSAGLAGSLPGLDLNQPCDEVTAT